MRRTIRLAAILAVVAMVFWVVTSSVGAGGNDDRLRTRLTGAEEAPGPGDPDGRGHAGIGINTERQVVCFRLEWRRLDPVTMTHIHKGPIGEAGPVVVTLLTAQSEGLTTLSTRDTELRACTQNFSPSAGGFSSAADLLADIKANPSAYYVNVHTTAFAPGAIRGQLGD